VLEAVFVPLVTGRLVLEPIAERHAEAMFAVLCDESLYRYMPSEAPKSLGELRDRYRLLEGGVSPDGQHQWLNWVIVPALHAVGIGYVQATIRASGGPALMGWTVGRASQRRGYAREAVAAVCSHLAAHGIAEIHATIDARNAASIGVAEASGFRHEHAFVSEDVIDGVRATDYGYVLRIADASA
jgi:RimJ/RimL family protein N-acetyltransferase